jgi:polyisoprenoid-binding protein YceI
MRRFLGVLGLVAVLVVAGCDRVGNTTTAVVDNTASTSTPTPPTSPGAGPSAAGEAPHPATPVASAAPGILTPENTKIEFVGTKKDGQHAGGFAQFSGSIGPMQGDFTAGRLAVEIDTESLFSDNPKLTNHLKAPDFFEVRKYPKASFASTRIQESRTGEATHLITGDLTLHGTTKSITIPAKVTQTEDTLALESTFTIDRLDYGIAYQPEMVNPIVTIKVTARVARK